MGKGKHLPLLELLVEGGGWDDEGIGSRGDGGMGSRGDGGMGN